MHWKHGRHWYVHKGKWTALSKDYADALMEYAALIRPAGPSDLMPAVIDRYMLDAKATVSKGTYRLYARCAGRLKKIFHEFRPDQVKPLHVAQMLDSFRSTPSEANNLRTVLKQVLSKAVLMGLTETNPVQFIPRNRVAPRGRYLTDPEFLAIRSHASPTMKAIMDMLYLTGQRIGDVLAIQHSDIEHDGIFFRQQKTGNRLKVAMTEDLREAVAAAKSLHKSVIGMTLFQTRLGRPIRYDTVRELWDRATKASGIEDAHIHDIRAKAATDARAQGLDSKKLLGHTSDSAHMRYLRSKEIQVAEPVSLKRT